MSFPINIRCLHMICMLLIALLLHATPLLAQFSEQVNVAETMLRVQQQASAAGVGLIAQNNAFSSALGQRLYWLQELSRGDESWLPPHVEAQRIKARAMVTVSLIDMAGQIENQAISRTIFQYIANCCGALWLHEAMNYLADSRETRSNTRGQMVRFAQEVKKAAEDNPRDAQHIPQFPERLQLEGRKLREIVEPAIAQLVTVGDLHRVVQDWESRNHEFPDMRTWLLAEFPRVATSAEFFAIYLFPNDQQRRIRNLFAQYLRQLGELHPMQSALRPEVLTDVEAAKVAQLDFARAVLTIELIDIGARAEAPANEIVPELLAMFSGSYHWVLDAMELSHAQASAAAYKRRQWIVGTIELVRLATEKQYDGHTRSFPTAQMANEGDSYLGNHGLEARRNRVSKAYDVLNECRKLSSTEHATVPSPNFLEVAHRYQQQLAIQFGRLLNSLALQHEALLTEETKLSYAPAGTQRVRRLEQLETEKLQVLTMTEALLREVLLAGLYQTGAEIADAEFDLLTGYSSAQREALLACAKDLPTPESAAIATQNGRVEAFLVAHAAFIQNQGLQPLTPAYKQLGDPTSLLTAMQKAPKGTLMDTMREVLHKFSSTSGISPAQLMAVRPPPALMGGRRTVLIR